MADQEKPKSVFLSLLKEQANKEGKLKPEQAPSQVKPQAQSNAPTTAEKKTHSSDEVRKELDKIIAMFGGDADNPSFETFAFNAQVDGVIENNGKDIDAILPRIFSNQELLSTVLKQLPPRTHPLVEKLRQPTDEQLAAFREEVAALSVLNQLPSHKDIYLAKLKANYDKTESLSLLVAMKMGQVACLAFTKASDESKKVLAEASKLLNEKMSETPSGEPPKLDAFVEQATKHLKEQKIKQFLPQAVEALTTLCSREDVIEQTAEGFGEKGTEALKKIASNPSDYAETFINEALIATDGPADNNKATVFQFVEDAEARYEASDLETAIVRNFALTSIWAGLEKSKPEVFSTMKIIKEKLEERMHALSGNEQETFESTFKRMFAEYQKNAPQVPDEPVTLDDWEWKDKAPYESYEDFVEHAKQAVDSFEKIVFHLQEAVEGKIGNNREDLEAYFKHIYYKVLVDFHLRLATFIQPGLMSTMLRVADDTGRSYLKPLIHFGHQKRMYATLFQELIVPVGRGANVQEQLHKFTAALPHKHYPIHDSDELAEAVLTNDRIDKTKVVDVFMQWSVFIQVSIVAPLAQSGFLEGFLNDSPKAKTNSKESEDLWPVYCLNHSLDSWKSLGKKALDHYPNQGPNIALQLCFVGHILNSDVELDERGNVKSMKPRYDFSRISKLKGKENLMMTQSGSHIFENMI